jgi:Protein of unknown function (DUF1579)
MTNSQTEERGSVATGVVRPVQAGSEVKQLDVFIGKWINEGSLVEGGAPGGKILTSDVYEWVPSGFFVVHSAYGRLAGADVGGVEIIGYDEASSAYHAWFFDSQGNVTDDPLLHTDDNVWVWQGQAVRSTSIFSADGKTQTTQHEVLQDGKWVPSMEVVLTKVE